MMRDSKIIGRRTRRPSPEAYDQCTAEAISGVVELGAASDHAIGPTTLGQFGRLPFKGRRVRGAVR